MQMGKEKETVKKIGLKLKLMIIKHRMGRKRMLKQRMTMRTGRMSTKIMSQKKPNVEKK